MLTVPLLLLVMAFGLSGAAVFADRGRGILSWAVLFVVLALLWPLLPR